VGPDPKDSVPDHDTVVVGLNVQGLENTLNVHESAVKKIGAKVNSTRRMLYSLKR